jgi:hypothetical protein
MYPIFTRFIVASVSFTFLITAAFAGYKDSIRHTELVTQLSLRGISVPTGSGVSVTQVEAPEATNAYMPNAADSQFAGKTITDQTGGGANSGHATTVGKNLYGNTTSIAPSITSIDVYYADDWINSGWYTGTPPTENNPLQNHSWVTWFEDNNAPRRMDYAVNRDGFLPIAGINNSDFGDPNTPSDIPDTYGSMYNGITVGVSDGTHRNGTTSYDGSGRVKPEIVTPSSYTSFATPYVTAAAAILIESAGSDTAAKDQLTLKAILLAGADKSPFASWDQTTTRPIDDAYGAGQLDVYENYFIQQAGQQAATSTIAKRGWNFSSVSSSSSEVYNINVPAGFELRNLSALVTWNRIVSKIMQGPFTTYTSSLANLSLSLTGGAVSQSSDSSVDNIEHIWRDSSNALASGSYTLTIASTSSTSTEYAIAWRSQLYQDYTLWSSTVFTASTPAGLRDATDDPDGDGIQNLHEQAFGGDPEANDINILPVSEMLDVSSQSYLQISYRKPDFYNGLTYTVETVTDLNGTWSSQSSEVELISIASESGGFDRYTYRLVDPISASDKSFLRVSVSQ